MQSIAVTSSTPSLINRSIDYCMTSLLFVAPQNVDVNTDAHTNARKYHMILISSSYTRPRKFNRLQTWAYKILPHYTLQNNMSVKYTEPLHV